MPSPRLLTQKPILQWAMTHLHPTSTSKHLDSGCWLSLAEHPRPSRMGKPLLATPWQRKTSVKVAVNSHPPLTSQTLHPLRNTLLSVNKTVQKHSLQQGVPSSTISTQHPFSAMKQRRCCRILTCQRHPHGCLTSRLTGWISLTAMPDFQAQWRLPT